MQFTESPQQCEDMVGQLEIHDRQPDRVHVALGTQGLRQQPHAGSGCLLLDGQHQGILGQPHGAGLEADAVLTDKPVAGWSCIVFVLLAVAQTDRTNKRMLFLFYFYFLFFNIFILYTVFTRILK